MSACAKTAKVQLVHCLGLGRTETFLFFEKQKRKGWDLNPRGAFTPTAFREPRLQPLGHPSIDIIKAKLTRIALLSLKHI